MACAEEDEGSAHTNMKEISTPKAELEAHVPAARWVLFDNAPMMLAFCFALLPSISSFSLESAVL